MKGLLFRIVLTAFLAVRTGFLAAVEVKSGATFDLADVPAEATAKLPKGGTFRLLLEENVTTGYRWEAAFSTNEVAITLEHRAGTARKGLMGAPGRVAVLAQLKGDDAAPVFVELAYRRPWEGNVPPAKHVRLVLYKVKPNVADFNYPASSRMLAYLTTECRRRGIVLTDWHVHIRGGLTPEMAAERERRTGIRQTAMENHGREWEICDNRHLADFAAAARRVRVNGHALPVGVQVNDRDWFRQIDAATRAKFDYVLADTMIMGKLANGRDKRLWLVKDLSEIGDPEKWMEDYMKMNLAILDEPISILANPTYLPAPLNALADTLWTEPRMRAIIAKAVAKGIALEIQAESPYPRPAFLKLAKAMGAKFSFGTNNYDAAPKDLTRWLEAITWLDLHAEDIWSPACLKVPAAPAWITGAYVPPEETNTAAFFAPAPNPIVEKRFAVRDKAIRSAVWRVAAPGMRDLSVNGTRVTLTALPPWTPYAKRILEESFDVTQALKRGAQNTLTVELGNGWYNPLPLTMWYAFDLRKALAIGTPCVRGTLDITYADGTAEAVVTDASWQAKEGRVIHNNLYLGVVEDGRRAVTPAGPARIVRGPAGRIVPAGAFPKTVIYNRRRARCVTPVGKGAYLVDFGVNAAGTFRVTLHDVKEGQRVSFRQGERIYPDGTLNPLSSVAGQIKNPAKGPLYAVAEARDTVICPAARTYVFEPRLTFHVFRYMQVEGLSKAPEAEDFEALDWSADVADAAAFVCSDARLNALHAMCRRTFRANLQSVQSDCPGREKFGYDGDVSCTAESFFCNYAMGDFYRKAVRDYLDEAADDGLFTETAPYVGIASNPAVGAYRASRAAPIGWATGVPVLLDTVLRYAGDVALVREAYPALVRYLDILAARYPAHDVAKCLGDWIPVAGYKADENLTGQAHYHQFVTLTAKFARLLGHAGDAARLSARAEAIAAAWRKRFYKGGGLVGRGLQAEQLFGLYHGLVPEKDVPLAYAGLKKDLAARDGALTTGIFGTQYLFEYLSAHGDAETAARALMHPTFPGYYAMMDAGATTLWESWLERDCLEIHSNCHPMYGSCEQWFMRHLLGIAVAEDAVGCDKVRIRPNAVGGVTWAKGYLDTPRGRISVAWKRVDGKMQVEKSVPPGITVLP